MKSIVKFLKYGFLAFLSLSFLILTYWDIQIIGILNKTWPNPANGQIEYLVQSNQHDQSVLIASALLLILGNLLSIKKVNREKIYFFLVCLFFSFFQIWDGFCLSDMYFNFKKENNLWKGEFSMSSIGTSIGIILFDIFIMVDYFILTRFKLRK